MRDKNTKSARPTQLGKVVAEYVYKDEMGRRRIRVRRYEPEGEPKTFRQDRWDRKNRAWLAGLGGTPRLLYRLPELLKAAQNPFGATVWVVEGEKDVEALVALRQLATTNAEGAGHWKKEFAKYFKGLDVRIIADKDERGLSHAVQVYRSVEHVAARCQIFECSRGKDVSEHLAAGGTLKQLKEITLAATAPKSTNGDRPTVSSAPEDPRLSRIVQWGYDKLWDDVPEGRVHNGRAAVAYTFAEQLRDVPDIAERAFTEWWHRLPQENDEGEIEPYPLDQALDTLRSALDNIPEDWAPGPLAKLNGRAAPERLIAGGTFVFSEPEEPEAVWGKGLDVLWPDGEGIMLTGPQGVGKSTAMQHLVLTRIGLAAPNFLGFPVRPLPEDRLLFYLAMDRPRQIARSLQRMVEREDLDVLNARMKVWRGALPFDVAKESVETLAEWCLEQAGEGCDVFCDSYKDLNPALSNEDAGGAINRAVQELLVAGMQWCGAHHHRKASSANKRPDKLDDVYGSNWLTAGLGSVMCLWGNPGSEAVELTHLKQPAEIVGPLNLSHDRTTGSITVLGETNLLEKLIEAGPCGVTSHSVALMFYGADDQNSRNKAERKLKKLVDEGCARHEPGVRGGKGGGGRPAMWFVV